MIFILLKGGYGIEDEMCVNYIHYYPAASIEVCKSAVDNTTLRKFFKKLYVITFVQILPNAVPLFRGYKSALLNPLSPLRVQTKLLASSAFLLFLLALVTQLMLHLSYKLGV
ncbi:unnamed protein product [Gongylonema pulchrum]|uniref:Cu2_monoox_C domain-containing protein n=1 Tax=Gongylonema pulchrum TaxID=637853 RepID=A0A183DVB4_9BILA|nr:unnamed protein product [Gongylonema pulchrum]